MIGLKKGEVKLSEYDSNWPEVFAVEAEIVKKTLKEHNIDAVIEHVGSTAIPGMSAKPIIDIAVGVANSDAASDALVALRASGIDYIKAANQPGMLFFAKGADERLFHYHLVVSGTHAWKRLVLFRDIMIRHRGLATEYTAVKQDLAARYPENRGAYTRAKGQYVRAVESRAFNEAQRRMQARTIGEASRRPNSSWPPIMDMPPSL